MTNPTYLPDTPLSVEEHATVERFGMAAPTEPLREQVARLLTDHQIESRGLSGNSPDTCSCGFKAFPAARVGYEDVSDRRAAAFAKHQAERLLPLFAARERAAAEKGWNEGAETATFWVNKGGWISDMPTNPYTALSDAQLEGDRA